MEHVSTVLSRTLSSLTPTNGAGNGHGRSLAGEPRDRRPATLHDLIPMFEAEETLENPDIVLPLRSLRATPGGTVQVPQMGVVAFNDWSRRQCASLLGVRWDRWFENSSPSERADELNRRFARASGSVRLRTSRNPDDASADGTLRAFVSPGYTPVADSRLARMLATVLAPADSELRLVRADVTDRSVSYVVKIGEAYRPGGPGDVGDIWGGVLVRNSGVGFASLLVSLHLTRLLCKNGMTAPLPDAVLVRRRHRALDDDALRGLLCERLDQLPERLGRGADLLRRAHERPVQDVEATLTTILDDADLPRRHVAAITAAYAEEPMPTAFGVSQAITRAAQGMSPELRVELEHTAGAYLASVASPPA
ncbi:MAG: hypothetical protein IT379_30510 [Deltaproteobacteria bacterium]|nr:hypothetical protein [Deltaproteobacteria bacterium]